MTYRVKEVFFSIQGEGVNAGRTAVFVRFAGCNLWSGRPEDRGRQGSCSAWCDTDFLGGDEMSAGEIVAEVNRHYPDKASAWVNPLVVLTGGEPLLQIDAALCDALQPRYWVAVETNGTVQIPPDVHLDHVTVSPKKGAVLRQKKGTELKLVYPQEGVDPEEYVGLDFDHLVLQPLDGPRLAANTEACLDYVKRFPHWRLSLQLHKLLGVR